jgi:hypothetical protein
LGIGRKQRNLAQFKRGGVKTKTTKVTYICRAANKKSSYLLNFIFIFICLSIFFLGAFWAFRNKGVQKHEKTNSKKSIWAHHKKCGFFFLRFFFFPRRPRLFCSIFFYRVFGRFVTRGVQKRDKNKSRENLLSLQNK